MTQHLIFLLLGLANGAVFASLALALVVTYRSSGVINFATGAIGLYTAYTYAFLRQGMLFEPIPGLPVTLKLGTDKLAFVPAAALSLLLTALLGLLLYVLVFRPLRTAPPVGRAVASLGIAVVLTGTILQRVGSNPVNVTGIFPSKIYKLGSVHVSGDRIYFAATVVLIALALAAAYRFTRFGLHTRAAAESEKGSYVSGISPDRVAAINWMIGAAVAGLAGILIAPIVPLVPAAYTLFIVPALAAAILGRFQGMAIAVAGGLVIGMLQSEAAYLKSTYSWLPASGLPELIPLVLILIVLVARTQSLPGRGEIIRHSLGRAPRPRNLLVPTVAATAVAVVGILALHGAWRAALITSLIFGIIELSQVVVTGYAGQVSLAQLVLAGAAAFLLSPLTVSWGVPFPIAPLVAAAGATVIGVVVGLPAVRIRGLPLAVVTLALAVALEALWFENTDFVSSSGKDIKGATLFGLDLHVGSGASFPRLGFCFMVLATLVIVGLGVAKLRTSRLGSAMLAVRANERSAAAAGINVVQTKLVAFAISSFIAGIGGALLAYKQTNVTFTPFDAVLGLSIFATAYLAGITSVSGGILAGMFAFGGLVFRITDKWLGLGGWYDAVTGLGLILTVVLNPEGIVGPFHAFLEQRRRRGSELAPGLVTAAARVPADRPTRVAASSTRPAVLTFDSVGVRYGGVVALDDVTFAVPEASIVGLIGPNGAGKTTLIDAISGFAASSGHISLNDQRLDRLRPYERTRAGLGRTFQAIELWDDLTVVENVGVRSTGTRTRAHNGDGTGSGNGDGGSNGASGATRSHNGADHGNGTGEHQPNLQRTLEMLGLDAVRDWPASELSQGQRQLVSIARALVGRPRVLLLDEPAAGLDSTESLWLGERLRDIRDDGVTILLIDHDMGLVLSLCDEVQVLNFGRLIASGPPSMVRADPVVAAAYLGSTHAAQPTSLA
jgi:ABC-type branched-subunit amino acid transport system ATPase component/branched-subunit amino acid ABC-type transport system permease component